MSANAAAPTLPLSKLRAVALPLVACGGSRNSLNGCIWVEVSSRHGDRPEVLQRSREALCQLSGRAALEGRLPLPVMIDRQAHHVPRGGCRVEA